MTSLLSGMMSYSRLICYIFCLWPGINFLQEGLVYFSEKWYFKITIWVLKVLIGTGVVMYTYLIDSYWYLQFRLKTSGFLLKLFSSISVFLSSTSEIIVYNQCTLFSLSPRLHLILVLQVYQFDQGSRPFWMIWSKGWVLGVRFYRIVRASEEVCWRPFPLSLVLGLKLM